MAVFKAVAPIKTSSTKVFRQDYVIDTIDKRLFRVENTGAFSFDLDMIDVSTKEKLEIWGNHIISNTNRYIVVRVGKTPGGSTVTWKLGPTVLRKTFDKVFK